MHPVPPMLSPGLRRFLGFATLSGLGWAADTAVTVGLHALGWPLMASALLGGSLAATGVFLASRRRIFAGTSPALPGLALYLAYSAAMIVAASGAVASLAGEIRTLWPGPEVLVALGAKVVVTPPLLMMNFIMAGTLSRFLSAKPTKPAEA